jgi:uncharacterized protein YbjT (DUF2867 family)
LFTVTTPFGADTATETRQGKALVDAASAARLGHVVLTSAAHADRDTGVPHYESKRLVEQHLRASGVPWTVIAPAAFMDNYASGWTLDGLRDNTFAVQIWCWFGWRFGNWHFAGGYVWHQ